MLAPHMHPVHTDGMRLSDYFALDDKLTDAAFAGRVGMSQSQINRLRRGASSPDWETIEKIKGATDGQVTADDWAAQAVERAASREAPAEASAA